MSVDMHHLLFDRRAWEYSVETKALRNDSGLIARIDRDCHNDVHDTITTVPLINRHMARIILNSLRGNIDYNDPLLMADRFMFAVQESTNNPRSNELDKGLGQLVIASVYHQKPFIEEGLAKARVIDLGGLGFRGKDAKH